MIDTDSPCGAMGKKKLFAFTDLDLKKTGFDEEKETAANWTMMLQIIFFGIKVIFCPQSSVI